ncbi:RNA polymerase sigma factor, sigma-70 family [Lentzea albidocapillata subsp. violacea]|uniref:RNA polymerase sigma factor, sigma-70 family n=1 Tax=Lentzea albidocapillata subsp. violacea TaxID=128104 RepID=A0A1G8YCG2_9PSEU|nr:sigma-70 family RNA polymerase sigma factor [Lentzea albidocapillata]SDK00599.1 RNA polymerase sigma factor, sigma-70 family [Lentzea albidocapillata subsp. violacea]
MATDAELIARVRAGATVAFEVLYARHIEAARARARQLSWSCQVDADDLVSEGFHHVLEILLTGRGPTHSFRGYLLTTITRAAFAHARKDARRVLTEDPHAHQLAARLAVQEPDQSATVENLLDRALALRAYRSLPATAQHVLWYIEICGMSPGKVAPLLHISANAVSARAHRAREDLRTAYLEAHLTGARIAPACAPFAQDLAAWVRTALRPRRRRRMQTHLRYCRHCRDLADDLAAVDTTPPATPFAT